MSPGIPSDLEPGPMEYTSASLGLEAILPASEFILAGVGCALGW